MVRLIVDDAGQRKAFNVGEGRLSVGSGNEAKLKLTSPGVASVHIDIEVHGDKATLHPKPGVLAPHVLGRTVNGPVVLQHGVPVKIGSATLTVEYEGQAARPAPVAAAPQRGAVVARRRAGEDDEEGAEGRSRRSKSQGVPSWVWIAAGVPLIAGLGWFLIDKTLSKDSRNVEAASAPAYYGNAVEQMKLGQFQHAKLQLDRIPPDAQLDPTLAANIAKLRAEIDKLSATAEEEFKNASAGQAYFESQLKAFVSRYMAGKITSPEARVFLKRARYFREHWPSHPELDWVTRQESRFKAAIDLGKPPTYDDVAFEVESLTWASPRNYREAFAVATAFQTNAQGEDLTKIGALLADLQTKRAAWFKDRMEQARWEYEGKNEGKAIGELLAIVRFSGDASMEDQAADQFLRFGDMRAWLRGYRTNQPEAFEAVSKNRLIADFIRANPLDAKE